MYTTANNLAMLYYSVYCRKPICQTWPEIKHCLSTPATDLIAHFALEMWALFNCSYAYLILMFEHIWHFLIVTKISENWVGNQLTDDSSDQGLKWVRVFTHMTKSPRFLPIKIDKYPGFDAVTKRRKCQIRACVAILSAVSQLSKDV